MHFSTGQKKGCRESASSSVNVGGWILTLLDRVSFWSVVPVESNPAPQPEGDGVWSCFGQLLEAHPRDEFFPKYFRMM